MKHTRLLVYIYYSRTFTTEAQTHTLHIHLNKKCTSIHRYYSPQASYCCKYTTLFTCIIVIRTCAYTLMHTLHISLCTYCMCISKNVIHAYTNMTDAYSLKQKVYQYTYILYTHTRIQMMHKLMHILHTRL